MENKILVVDDEEAIRELLERAFTKAGYTVCCAGSGEGALEVLKQEDIQVMFLDLKLPELNGVELCSQIRKDKPNSKQKGGPLGESHLVKPWKLLNGVF